MPFECLDGVCAPAVTPERNEDLVYCDARLALVLDGATGLGEPLLAGEGSDARWLVHAFTQQLCEALGQHAPVLGALERAVSGVTMQFWQRIGRRDALPTHRLPSAGMALAALEGETLVLARLGDCSLLTLASGAVQRPFPPSPLEALDRRAIDALRHHLNAGLSYAEARAAIKERLQAHRDTMNTPGGYSALSVDPHCLAYLQVMRLPVEEAPERLLLASDGFAAAYDHYGLCTPEGILSGEAGRLSALVERIRRLEDEDATLARYPRLKPHDDASALVLSLVG